MALWGRRLCLDPSTRTWVDANDDENAAICAAARRVIFLEAHPEQVLRVTRTTVRQRKALKFSQEGLFLTRMHVYRSPPVRSEWGRLVFAVSRV